ncbi:MAG: hypothetical protein CV045_13590 [Cyanobacteria bacterium M5B4]|nr:MAG: hypothetical protein CV045_13590 [Cyanobacteria bacterium M5B4]
MKSSRTQKFRELFLSLLQRVQETFQVDMEGVKYALWLNPLRCSAFFASRILVVEGATEATLIGYMFNEGQIQNPSGGIFVLDAIGKYNIHHFMNLFGELGIPHAVLYDRDSGKPTGVPIETIYRVPADTLRSLRSARLRVMRKSLDVTARYDNLQKDKRFKSQWHYRIIKV